MARSHPLERYRNIGIMAHIDAGKTTTTERILYYTGKSYKIGEVHDGAATMDWMEQEQERGITITSAATTCFWQAEDGRAPSTASTSSTPPATSTSPSKSSARCACSTARSPCFDGVAGVEPQSETVWRQADKYGVPRMCFINKLDRTGANFNYCVQSIIDRLGAKPAGALPPDRRSKPTSRAWSTSSTTARSSGRTRALGAEFFYEEIPADLADEAAEYRSELIELAVEQDDDAMEAYLEGNEPDVATLKALIRKGTLSAGVRAGRAAARRSRTRASSPCSTPWSTTCLRRSTSRTSRASRWTATSRTAVRPRTTRRSARWRSRS